MIYGSYCLSGAGSPPAYPGALGVTDFVNGVYQLSEVNTDIATMIDQPLLISPGQGLRIQWDTDGGVVHLLGSFLTIMCSYRYTAILEYSDDNNDWSYCVLDAMDASFNSEFGIYAPLVSGAAGVQATDYQNSIGNSYLTTSSAISPAFPGNRKIAVTRASDHLAMSVNGGSVITTSGTFPTTYLGDDAVLGGQYGTTWAAFSGYIRKLIFYPVQLDTDLPGLSTM